MKQQLKKQLKKIWLSKELHSIKKIGGGGGYTLDISKT